MVYNRNLSEFSYGIPKVGLSSFIFIQNLSYSIPKIEFSGLIPNQN